MDCLGGSFAASHMLHGRVTHTLRCQIDCTHKIYMQHMPLHRAQHLKTQAKQHFAGVTSVDADGLVANSQHVIRSDSSKDSHIPQKHADSTTPIRGDRSRAGGTFVSIRSIVLSIMQHRTVKVVQQAVRSTTVQHAAAQNEYPLLHYYTANPQNRSLNPKFGFVTKVRHAH